jgi:hypothetical protein
MREVVTLFVGPSGHGVPCAALAQSGVALRPPVRRGDIDHLIGGAREPGIIVLCDGALQTGPAVSHAEIGRAIDGGWQVWGVSSIGAIRAFEMRDHGMHGFGYVHSLFHRLEDFTDDEMCLLHLPEEPWFPASEPLVNLRYALEQRGRELGIAEGSQQRVLAALGNLWFGDRTDATMRTVLVEQGRASPAVANALLLWLREHRVKTMDLLSLMAARPWQELPASAERSRARRPRASSIPRA